MNKLINNQNIENFKSNSFEWRLVQSDMRDKLGSEVYESWLKKISFIEEFNNYILLSVPTRFIRDWITSRYLDQILQIIKIYKKDIARIEFRIVEKNYADQSKQTSKEEDNLKENISFIKDSYLQYNRIDPNKRFDNFITGSSNKLAYEASLKVSENISHYNPLYIYGGVGMGKTHLLNSIGYELKKNNKVMFISAERFMYQFVKSIKSNDMVKFKEYFRNTDILLIDDIQFMNGKEAMQEEFFHTFNALIEQNKQIVISADKSPTDLDGVQERLKSRLGCGLVADIHPTTYELRLGILIEKAQKRGVEIPPKVLEFLSHRIISNVREMEGALNRLVAHGTLVGTPITIETAQLVLQDLLKSSNKKITIEEIQKKVAEHFNIRITDMHSPRRSRSVARPRQIAMYLAKSITSRSLPEIGRKFGGRDHTTVMHAVKKIEELKLSDVNFNEDLELLKRLIDS